MLVVQNIGVGVSENIDSALAVRNTVSGWQTELNNPAISPDRVIELTNLIQTLDLSARGINQGEANSQSSRLGDIKTTATKERDDCELERNPPQT